MSGSSDHNAFVLSSRLSQGSKTAIGIALALLLALVFHWFAFESWQGFHSLVDHNTDPFEDFTGPYYAQALALREGRGLQPGYMYPPALALFMWPLTVIGPLAASWIWFAALSLASVLLFVVGLRWLKDPSPRLVFAYSLFFALSFPWLHDLHWGQVSTLVWALSLYGLQAWCRGRHRRAALALSLAISIKIFPVWLLVIYPMARDRRGLAWVAGFCMLWLAALPLLVLGWESTSLLYTELAERLGKRAPANISAGQFWGPRMSQFAPAVLSRVWGGAQGIWLLLAWALPATALALTLHAAQKHMRAGQRDLALILLVCTTPLWLSPSWIHYFVWLPCIQFKAWQTVNSRPAQAAVLTSILLSCTPFFFLAGAHPGYGMGGYLLLSAMAIPLASALSSATNPTPALPPTNAPQPHFP